MKTAHDIMRDRLLARAGLTPLPAPLKLDDLFQSEWSPRFEQLQRNRLVMGALRYGRLHAPGKPVYDRIASMRRRLALYAAWGNMELLVDVANLCLLEFEENHHPLGHFESHDDGEHVQSIGRKP